MYIDHRVDPGPPRPGYLERIIDGAVHHGFRSAGSSSCDAGIRRNWPRSLDRSGSDGAADHFQSYSPIHR